ncbi:hypothetical protein D2E95_09195 [Mycobacteroides abscessus]|nr:hypothetical protein D2E95_09195 [Mycobacteroides abscessus]RIU52531.1 hypothetical protein D2F02_05835 [Mycobacteroides abscessus]
MRLVAEHFEAFLRGHGGVVPQALSGVFGQGTPGFGDPWCPWAGEPSELLALIQYGVTGFGPAVAGVGEELVPLLPEIPADMLRGCGRRSIGAYQARVLCALDRLVDLGLDLVGGHP